ncbi:hypothetical protein [Cupriavidus necator]
MREARPTRSMPSLARGVTKPEQARIERLKRMSDERYQPLRR